MSDYTVTLTTTEEKALKSVMVDINEWATNYTKVRAKKAIVDITTKLLEHCNANSITLATGVDAQIDQAYSLGLIQEARVDDSPPVNPGE